MRKGAYTLDCIGTFRGKIQINAINVPATPYSRVQGSPGALTATLSSLDPSCNLMLTTQFIGCCYCFMVNETNLAAAHIDPEKKVTGQHVSQQLRAHGGFSNGVGGTFRAYGRVDDGSRTYGYPQSAYQMIIVAVRQRAWEVYAQIAREKTWDTRRIDG
jgi:hypothetical protein